MHMECERKLDRLQFAVSQITTAIVQSLTIARCSFVTLMKLPARISHSKMFTLSLNSPQNRCYLEQTFLGCFKFLEITTFTAISLKMSTVIMKHLEAQQAVALVEPCFFSKKMKCYTGNVTVSDSVCTWGFNLDRRCIIHTTIRNVASSLFRHGPWRAAGMPSRDSHSFLSFPFWRTCIRRRSKVRATVLDYFQPGTSWPLEFLDVSRQIRPYLSHLLRRGQDRAYRFDRDRRDSRYGTSFDYMKNERYFFQIYLSTFVSIVRRYGCRRGSIYCDKHTLKRNTLCQKHTNGN